MALGSGRADAASFTIAASGRGYTVWYAAWRHHTPTRAAVLQLSVLVSVAILGIGILDEASTLRLTIAGSLILGGIAMTVVQKQK